MMLTLQRLAGHTYLRGHLDLAQCRLALDVSKARVIDCEVTLSDSLLRAYYD